jgi:hypothetical protein
VVVETGSGISTETVLYTYRPVIELATRNQRLVVLNALSSRSNAGPITRSSVAPWTVTGTDSITTESYSYTFEKANSSEYTGGGAYNSESYETAKAGINVTGGTWTVSEGTKDSRASINLSSSNNCTSSFKNSYLGRTTYCSVFGPEVYSEPFFARAGQALSFNWIAEGGSDHYEVYAFLVAVSDENLASTPADSAHTLLAHGMGTRESTWKTSSGNIPTDGLYRFRFVNGSFDYTGGFALGARMFVDQTITVGDANTITFPVIGDQIGASGTFTHELTSTSGQAVSIVSSTSGICTVSASHSGVVTTATITKVSAGTCILTTSQGASGVFAPAAQVTRAFEIRASAIAPLAPAITSIVGENGQLRVNFNIPDRDGGEPITNYKYRIGSGSWVALDPSSTSSPMFITGLTNGTSYSITIRAVNSVGDGTISTAVSGTPQASAPSAPVISAITPSDETLSVAFTAPTNDGGSAISNYEYSLDGGSWVTPSPPVTSSPLEITGLINGTAYSVRLRAVNNIGGGAASNSVVATPTDVVVTPPAPPAASGPIATPTPTPTPTPTVTPRPNQPRRPAVTVPTTPRQVATPIPSPTPTITAAPAPSPNAVSTVPMAIPEREATPGVVYTPTNPIPQELVEVLFSPLAYEATASSTPALPTLTPTQSVAFENGAQIEVQLVVTDGENGYLLQGDNWQVALEATDTQGQPLALDNSGNIILNNDRFVQFQGTGFAPGSIIKVWLFSDPTSLADVTADSSGNFTGRSQLPAEIAHGEHTVQLNGLSKNGQVRSVALGVLVQPEAIAAPTITPIDFAPLWNLALVTAGVVMMFLLVLLGRRRWFLFLATRKKRKEEKKDREIEELLISQLSEVTPLQQFPVDSRRRLGKAAPPKKSKGTPLRKNRPE